MEAEWWRQRAERQNQPTTQVPSRAAGRGQVGASKRTGSPKEEEEDASPCDDPFIVQMLPYGNPLWEYRQLGRHGEALNSVCRRSGRWQKNTYPSVVIVTCLSESRGVATFIVPAFRPKPMFPVFIVSRLGQSLRREGFPWHWRNTWKGGYRCWGIEQSIDSTGGHAWGAKCNKGDYFIANYLILGPWS